MKTSRGEKLPLATGKLPLARRGQRGKRGKRRGRLELRSGHWCALFMVNGVRHFKNLKTSDRAEAERLLEDELKPYTFNDEERTARALLDGVRAVEEKRSRYEADHSSIPLESIFYEFKSDAASPDASEKSVAEYGVKLGRFVRWAGEFAPDVRTMQDVTFDHVSEFMETISGSFSNNTYNKYATMLSCVWRVLSERGRLASNPWARVRRKRNNTHSRRELTVEELRRVAVHVTGEMRLLFAVGMYTGLRLGDCARLDWGNVDMIRRHIEKVQDKTGRRVVVPVHASLKAILDETPPEKRIGPVVPGLRELYDNDSSALVRRIQRIFEDCGISTNSRLDTEKGNMRVDVGFHSLRHTFVSMAANAGAPFAVVQAIVGHSSMAMTRHYYHENEAAMRQTVAALPDVSGEACKSDDCDGVRVICSIAEGMSVEQILQTVKRLRMIVERRNVVCQS